jgi:hypothetical protein
VQEEVVDQEEEEPLATTVDEYEMEADEEAEAEAEPEAKPKAKAKAANQPNVGDGEPPNGMPGQLTMESQQPSVKDYATI